MSVRRCRRGADIRSDKKDYRRRQRSAIGVGRNRRRVLRCSCRGCLNAGERSR